MNRLQTTGSWLGRRNPTVKVAVLLVVSLGTLVLLDLRPLLALYVLAVGAVLTAARVPPRALALAQVPFVLFGVSLVLVNVVSRPVDGLVVGTGLALRGLVIGVLTIGFLASTPPRDLMVSLVQHAHLSPRYAYALMAGHRMLAAMPQRWSTIRAAHAVRAPLDRRGRPQRGVRDAGRSAFALLVSSIRSAERTALAMETRGLGGPHARSVRRPVALGWADAGLAVGVLVVFALAVSWQAA